MNKNVNENPIKQVICVYIPLQKHVFPPKKKNLIHTVKDQVSSTSRRWHHSQKLLEEKHFFFFKSGDIQVEYLLAHLFFKQLLKIKKHL